MIGYANSGSGGMISPNTAVVHVQAPVGSTITFLKDNIIIKVLNSNKGHISADDSTYADWYYAINTNAFGTWEIQAFFRNESTSKTILVDEKGEYLVWLTYNFYIVNHGHPEITISSVGDTSFTREYTDYLLCQSTYNSSDVFYAQVDVTNYNTLVCKIKDYYVVGDSGGIGVQSNVPTKNITATTKLIRGTETPVILQQDISSITGTKYIYLREHSDTYAGPRYIQVADFYLTNL